MTSEDLLLQEEELTKIESKAIDSYIEDIYSKKVPEPEYPSKNDLSFWKIAGIEATLFTISGIAIVIYSAIRTGGLFYIMETLLLREFNLPDALISTFSLSSMITSLGAFELYVLADGFSKGKENKNLKRSNIGLFSSLGVIVLAGVFTGLGLVPNLNETFKMIFYTTIAIITAIAGGLVALYSGENIGFTVLRVEKTRDRLIKSHTDNYLKWKENAIKSYQASRYAIGSKKSNDFIENLNKTRLLKNIPESPSSDITEEAVPMPKNNLEIFENVAENDDPLAMDGYDNSDDSFLIYESITKFVKQNGRLPRNSELDEISYEKQKTVLSLSKFIVNHKTYLVKAGIINQETLQRAEKYLEKNK